MSPSNTRIDVAIRTVITAGALLTLAGCKDKPTAPAQGPPPPEVAFITVMRENVPETPEFNGAVVPFRRVEVRARVDGIIEERPFNEGMVVKPGQVLYRLDKIKYESAHRSAQARLQNAERTLQRLEPLLAQHAVAQQDVDNARANFEAAQAALDNAKKDLDDTDVRAQIEGRVGRTILEVGARVTGPSDLLTTIDRLDPVYVTFRPSSQQLLAWQEDARSRAMLQPGGGLQVEVVLPDGGVLPRRGRLDFVAPSLDPATGTQEFRAIFENRDRLLMPGQFVRVRLIGFARTETMAVPQRAVQTGLGRQFVYVVSKGDTVTMRDVVTGPWSGERWVIEQGLEPGDRVIVDGLQKVAPGRPVKPVPLGALPADNKASGGGPVR